jgi:hypothetical protein
MGIFLRLAFVLGGPNSGSPTICTYVIFEGHTASGQSVDHNGDLRAELLGFDADAPVAVGGMVPVGEGEDADADGLVAGHIPRVAKSRHTP